MDADPQMERVLAGGLRDVFVGADTGSLECLAGELLVLIGDEMAAERELVHRGTLATEIEDANLCRVSSSARELGKVSRTFGSGTPRLYLLFG